MTGTHGHPLPARTSLPPALGGFVAFTGYLITAAVLSSAPLPHGVGDALLIVIVVAALGAVWLRRARLR